MNMHLEEQLTSAPVLACDDFKKPFILEEDAGHLGSGGCDLARA